MNTQVDVIINVFGKPYQTALSLLSLLKHSGHRIGTIYFQEEPATSEYEKKGHGKLIEFLGDRVVRFVPKHWNGIEPVDMDRLATDRDYLLSMRYQHGWEQSQAEYVLTVHNDIQVHGDVVGNLLEAVGDKTGAGEIGQCWWCPAGQTGLCVSHRYTEYKPTYDQLMRIYRTDFDQDKRRAYIFGLSKQFQANAWPLPECRLNEWCALINIEKARKDTMPFGTGAPIGAIVASGSVLGKNRDHHVSLDTGVQWFRDMNRMGHRFVHYDIYRDIDHDRLGNAALSSPELYIKKEIMALHILKNEHPEFHHFLTA